MICFPKKKKQTKKQKIINLLAVFCPSKIESVSIGERRVAAIALPASEIDKFVVDIVKLPKWWQLLLILEDIFSTHDLDERIIKDHKFFLLGGMTQTRPDLIAIFRQTSKVLGETDDQIFMVCTQLTCC